MFYFNYFKAYVLKNQNFFGVFSELDHLYIEYLTQFD